MKSPSWNRREFVTSLAGAGTGWLASGCAGPDLFIPGRSRRRPRIAILGTVLRKYSHLQHFVDRFTEGYGWEGRWHHPDFELAGLFVDQFPDDDLARERAARFGFKLYPSVEEALTLGGSRLAVDGVVIIGEHGKYPVNEKKQTLYPRYDWFKRTVRVFESSGRSVPVFNDKHLSTDWKECMEMVGDSRRLGFAFLAGSSLPVTWRVPDLAPPLGVKLRESLCICYGGVDSYDFHGFETAQCISERRRGGEVGVRSVQAHRGPAVCDFLESRESTRRLAFAALQRSQTVKAPDGYTCVPPSMAWLRANAASFTAFDVEHLDGFRTTLLLLNGLVLDFTYAGLTDSNEILSTLFHLPMPPRLSTLADFFNPLVNHIERTFATGRTTYPIERALLTSGMTALGVESIHRDGARIDTPRLDVAYQGVEDPGHWRI